jgi:hypothetical protein
MVAASARPARPAGGHRAGMSLLQRLAALHAPAPTLLIRFAMINGLPGFVSLDAKRLPADCRVCNQDVAGSYPAAGTTVQ